MRFAASVVVILAGTAAARAADLHVPGDFDHPRDALLAADPGDRVVVRGGTWRNGRIFADDVALVGRGAVFTGLWEVSGSNVTIERCTFADFRIEITGDGVVVRENRMEPRGSVHADAAGFRFEDNVTRGVIVSTDATSSGAVAARNRMTGGSISLRGRDPVVEDNAASGIECRDGTGGVIRRNRVTDLYMIDMSAGVVAENDVRGFLSVQGDGVLVEANRLRASRGIHVRGDDAVVRGNVGSVRQHDGVILDSFGIRIQGMRGVVRQNTIRTRGLRWGFRREPMIEVLGDDAVIASNRVVTTGNPGIGVQGDGALVTGNEVVATRAGAALRIRGADSVVAANTVEQRGSPRGGPTATQIEGDRNEVRDHLVLRTDYDGVSVAGAGNRLVRVEVRRAGRCGLSIADGSNATEVTDCIVTNGRWASLYVRGTDATVTGGTFTGARQVDILDLGVGTHVVGTTFGTITSDPGLAPFR